MRIHADFSKRVVVRPNDVEWTPSPMAGVERKMLDRIGEEVARASSIVRYAPGSKFSEHEHGGGEEFFVLEGTFSDEYADYPAGSYVRNPIGTRHTPHSHDGCTIFVKLHQFEEGDRKQFSILTLDEGFYPGPAQGLSLLPLHSYGRENVTLVRWQPGSHFKTHGHYGGEEILVIEGTFQDDLGVYPKGTWLRNPHMFEHQPFSENGCLIYVKTGHLDVAN